MKHEAVCADRAQEPNQIIGGPHKHRTHTMSTFVEWRAAPQSLFNIIVIMGNKYLNIIIDETIGAIYEYYELFGKKNLITFVVINQIF